MKRRVGLGLTLAVCAAVEAAEPASTRPAPADGAIPVAAPAIAPVTEPQPGNALRAEKPLTRKPLDLRVGDIRTYMMPNEYHAVLGAPDADANTVVVEGKRELLPVEYEKPIPMGPLVPLWWGLTHPASSWRIFLPDINRPPEGPREPEDKIPPPIFRWGP
jgi:hypothetical protein